MSDANPPKCKIKAESPEVEEITVKEQPSFPDLTIKSPNHTIYCHKNVIRPILKRLRAANVKTHPFEILKTPQVAIIKVSTENDDVLAPAIEFCYAARYTVPDKLVAPLHHMDVFTLAVALEMPALQTYAAHAFATALDRESDAAQVLKIVRAVYKKFPSPTHALRSALVNQVTRHADELLADRASWPFYRALHELPLFGADVAKAMTRNFVFARPKPDLLAAAAADGLLKRKRED